MVPLGLGFTACWLGAILAGKNNKSAARGIRMSQFNQGSPAIWSEIPEAPELFH